MHPIVQKLQDRGVPVSGYLAAVRFYTEQQDLSTDKYLEGIMELSGQRLHIPEHHMARMVFLYLVQESVRKHVNGDVLVTDDLVKLAQSRATEFAQKHGWVFAQPEEETAPKIDAAGNPKQKKGAKQEQAAELYQTNKEKSKKEIIAIFIKEIGMTPAGAQTYFYNCKKKFS